MLPDHRQHKQKLTPPLMRFPMTELSWHREMLPDFLWIAMMLGRWSDWTAAYSALDVVDRFVPEGPRFADGRLTTFALVPEDRREDARTALRDEAPHALPEAFGHAVGLYPTCPARWLFEDWLDRHEPDPAVGLPLLRSLVAEHKDKSGVRETRLRMVAIARRVTHGKIFFQQGSAFHLLAPKYPSGLTESEQRQVESMMRASYASALGAESIKYPEIVSWPEEFWRQSRELVPCQIPFQREEDEMPETEDGPLDAEPLMQLSEMRRLVKALDSLGDELRDVQRQVVIDPEADEPNAVLLGLASRLYSLLYAFAERPSAWSSPTAGLHLRPMVDARILIGWLITRNDPAMFAAYREHGLGRLKLLREHLKADFGDDPDDEVQEMLDHYDQRVNLERDENFQPVNLGSIAGVSPRQMAIEADLKRAYDLAYAPLSSENHGEWPTVREDDTILCTEPLHGGHRVGAFAPPSRTVTASPVFLALEFARDGICQVFSYFGRDVHERFDPVQKTLEEAAYDGGGEQTGHPSD